MHSSYVELEMKETMQKCTYLRSYPPTLNTVEQLTVS